MLFIIYIKFQIPRKYKKKIRNIRFGRFEINRFTISMIIDSYLYNMHRIFMVKFKTPIKVFKKYC